MGNLRFAIRFILAFISRFRALLIIGVLTGVVLFSFFGYLYPKYFGFKQEKIGITGRFEPDSLPFEIQDLIGQGLTRIGTDGTVEPALAESWNTPDKGKTWIFTLFPDKKWQDGETITSSNINYEFTDVNVEKPDQKTLVFKLESPFGAFPSVVSRPIFKKGLLGTGDWKVEKISVSGTYTQQLVLKNNNEKKVFKFYPSEDRTKLAFKLGEVDKLEGLFSSEPFGNWKTVQVSEEVDQNRIVAIFLNTQDQILSEKTIRQAMAYAIDKDIMGPRAISPIASNSWAFNSQVKNYAYSPTRAKEIIEDLPKGSLSEVEFTLFTSPTLINVADKVVKNWNDVGLKSKVQIVSGIPTDYQAFMVIFDIPRDPDQYVLWHSTQTNTNISKYQNPRIDKLLEDGRIAVDTEARKEIYLDFQRFLLEDSPAIFLYHPKSFTVTRK